MCRWLKAGVEMFSHIVVDGEVQRNVGLHMKNAGVHVLHICLVYALSNVLRLHVMLYPSTKTA